MGDIGEIVRGEGEQYLQKHRVTPQQRKALAYMGRCRTESMGLLGKVVCEECDTEYPIFRSCRNRNCPGCQAEARAAWLEACVRCLFAANSCFSTATKPISE